MRSITMVTRASRSSHRKVSQSLVFISSSGKLFVVYTQHTRIMLNIQFSVFNTLAIIAIAQTKILLQETGLQLHVHV